MFGNGLTDPGRVFIMKFFTCNCHRDLPMKYIGTKPNLSTAAYHILR